MKQNQKPVSWNYNASLNDLATRHPDLWETVNDEIIETVKTGKASELASYVQAIKARNEQWQKKLLATKDARPFLESAERDAIKARMTYLALSKLFLSAAAGTTQGKIRFGLLNGLLLQRLLFRGNGFKRKPVNLLLYRLFWPLVTQKAILMPLVARKGIYCFYSQPFVRRLAALLQGKTCLEIAAGDGTLSEFLRGEGVEIHATDDYSWAKSISIPNSIEKLDARSALQKYKAQVIICSWPPAGNAFERFVFTSPSAHTYIAIGSRHRFASGDWKAYNEQTGFDWRIDEELSNLVLPRENDNAVLVFQRKG